MDVLRKHVTLTFTWQEHEHITTEWRIEYRYVFQDTRLEPHTIESESTVHQYQINLVRDLVGAITTQSMLMMTSKVTTSILNPNMLRICRRQLSIRRSDATDTMSSISSQLHVLRQQPLHKPVTASGKFSTTKDTSTNVDDGHDDNRSKILSLYRSIRRIHETSLPTNLRTMGNKYLQSEFRTLKDTTKMTPIHFQNFMSEWERYRQQLLQSQKEMKFGQPLPSDVALTTEQQEQLRKLHQEVTSAKETGTDNKLGWASLHLVIRLQ